MPDPKEIVNNALTGETDEPSRYVDWLGRKTEVGEVGQVRFGFYIHTTDDEVIAINAKEDGVETDDKFWEQIASDARWLEENAANIARKMGLYIQGEGHGETGEYVASAWVSATALPNHPKDEPLLRAQTAVVRKILELDGDMPSTTAGTFWKFFPGSETELYKDVSELGRKYLDVTVEFTGTDALAEWLKLNVVESKDPDDPEAFVKHYVPRLKGNLNVDFNAIKPDFPDVPNYFYRQNVDGLILFRYNSASEMRDLLKSMKQNEGSDLFPRTYRYKVPNPRGHTLARQFLEQAGAGPETMELIEKTNAPIYFYIPVSEFHNYVRLVYPQVKLREDLEVDDPEAFVKNFNPFTYVVNWEDNHGDYFHTKPLKSLERALEFASTSSLYNKSKSVWIEKIDAEGLHHKTYAVDKNYEIEYAYDSGTIKPTDIGESEDIDDPKHYVDRLQSVVMCPKCHEYATLDAKGKTHPASQIKYDTTVVVPQTENGMSVYNSDNPQHGGDIKHFKDIPVYRCEKCRERFDLEGNATINIKETAEDVDDPTPYLNRVTGWIDTFLNAGFTPNLEDTHRGQFWKRYECTGFSYLVTVGTREPRWIIVERNDALYGTNYFRRVFEYRDARVEIDSMVTEFKIIDRILTKARTSAFDGFPAVDEKINNLYRMHQRERGFKIKEAVDDPEIQHYLNQASPEPCFACGADLTQPHSVVRHYVGDQDELTLEGHYDPDEGVYTNDEPYRPEFLEKLSNYDLPHDPDTCKKCGQNTAKRDSLRSESVEEAKRKQLKTAQTYRVQVGQTYWFEYHCLEAHHSQDADLWYRSHQPVKVLKLEEPGIGKDETERIEIQGAPAAFIVQFKDGSTGTAMEDELLDSPNDYTRPDPPEPRNESVDEPEANPESYLNQIHDVHDITHDIQNYGMFVNRIEHWGKWVILGGGAYWATLHGTDNEPPLKADFFREQLEKFMAALGITQFHIKAGQTGIDNEHVWFKIGIPKSQLTAHSWEEFKRNTTGWPDEPNSTWLPESADPDDPAVNIERHTAALDLPAIMDRLGFKPLRWRHLNVDYWEKVIGPRVWRVEVNAAAPKATVTSRAAFGTPEGWIEPTEDTIPINQIESVLSFLEKQSNAPSEEIDEALAVPDPDDADLNVERYAQHVEQTRQWKLDSIISRAEDDFELQVDRRNINNARAADELVGELALKWGEGYGYKNGSDEYDWIVSALNNKAGELFPGNWEDYPPEDHPVQESDLVSDKMDWTEFFAPLIEYNQLSQQAADRYAISQNLESNEKLYYLFLEADEASQYANDADYNACIDKILRIIRVTNMRYNSAIKGIMRDVPLDEAKDDVDAEAYIKSQPLEVMARAYNVRDRSDALKFNCAPWFEQATLEDLVDLAKGSTLYGPFNRSFSADMVAGHMARLIPALKELLDRSDKLDVYINEDDAKRWMEHNRADWYAYLWPNDMLGEGVADPDDIDPKQYAMSLEVFDPTKVVEDMTAMGWKSAGLRLAYPDENVWLLEWWSYKELTNDMPEAAYQAEAKMALEDAKKAVKNACPEADQFEWYAPFSDGDFGLYFKIPERLKPLKTRTWENLDDPTPELLHSTFDVPTILKRMGYERHGEQQEWSKDFRRYPTDLDLMIGVRRRGLGGESNEGDALYDITLYIYPVHDNPEKRWSEVAHRYSRNNLQLERVLKVLEARIKANNLRGIVPDPDITENLELDDPDAVEPPPGHYLKQLCDLNLTDTLQAHGLGSNLNGNYGSGTIKLGNKATLQYHGVRQFNGVNVAISMYSFRQVASVSCYLQPRYDRDVLTKKKFVFRFRSIPICKLPEVINTMLTDITDICRNNLGTWPEMMTQFKAKMAQFNQYRPFNVKTKVAKPVAEAADPDDPEMVLAAHTQDLVADPDVPNKIHSHTHGKLTSDLEALGFETSWVAGRGVIFGEPYVPTFWSKRYPAANRSRILFVEISNEHGNVVLGLRTRFMPVPIRLKPRSMDHLLVIVRDTDAVMQRAAAENLAKPQERDALLDTLEKHQQWCVKEAVEEPVPDPDDPETVLKSYQHGLLDGELKRLGFAPIFTQGVTHLYGRPMLDYWTKEYTATDGSQRALYLYFMSGHKPAIRANNWNPIAKAWYQRGKEWPTDALGKSEAHFCAIIRDLDAAMSRSAADSLPPDQEHEAVEAILKHHREWYDQTLTNWHSHGITGQIGPGRPA